MIIKTENASHKHVKSITLQDLVDYAYEQKLDPRDVHIMYQSTAHESRTFFEPSHVDIVSSTNKHHTMYINCSDRMILRKNAGRPLIGVKW